MEALHVSAGAAGLKVLTSRALHLDAQASARFAVLSDAPSAPGSSTPIDVFVTTPFDCVASRRVTGSVSRDGAVVSARDLDAALAEGRSELGPARDHDWIGALPPKTGFVEREIVPVAVVRDLADQGRRLARQFSGPLGPPRSLLEQIVLTVQSPTTPAESSTPTDAVEIPMRMIFTCTSLGLIPGPSAPPEIPRHLRISTAGRWIRMDAPFGSVYHSAGLNLLF
ncbi:hypothetical protein KBX18_08795 [Corynebacterium sp. CCUG 69979]|nr:hypothetical protein [Corynebacterium sp. CCUG 69979]MCQ4625646.1 hypothetical protein [Corynebacterium sp. CCUG 69979]